MTESFFTEKYVPPPWQRSTFVWDRFDETAGSVPERPLLISPGQAFLEHGLVRLLQ